MKAKSTKKQSFWNDQHIKEGRMVAYRPYKAEKTIVGQVMEVNSDSATVQFACETLVCMKEDLTPIFSKIAP